MPLLLQLKVGQSVGHMALFSFFSHTLLPQKQSCGHGEELSIVSVGSQTLSPHLVCTEQVFVVLLQILSAEHPHTEHLSTNLPLSQYFGLVIEQLRYGVSSEHLLTVATHSSVFVSQLLPDGHLQTEHFSTSSPSSQYPPRNPC